MGDPSGMGPEVTVKALADLEASERRGFAVIGDRAVLGRALAASGVDLPLVQPGGDGIAVVDVPVAGLPARFGVLSPRCGEACFQYIRTAVEWAQAGRAAGIVTAPINKAALKRRRPPLRRPYRWLTRLWRPAGRRNPAKRRKETRRPRHRP